MRSETRATSRFPDDATIDVAPTPPAVPVILEPTDAAHPIALEWPACRTSGAAPTPAASWLSRSTASPGAALSPSRGSCSRGRAPSGGRATWRSLPTATAPPGRSTPTRCRWGTSAPAPSTSTSMEATPTRASTASRPTAAPSPWPAAPSCPGSATRARSSGSTSSPVRSTCWWRATPSTSPGRRTGRVSPCRSNDGGRDQRASRRRPRPSIASSFTAAPATDTHLRWSPDGDAARLRPDVVVARGRASDPGTRVRDQRRSSTSRPGREAPPGWSSDGRLLAWTSASGDHHRIRVLDTVTGEEVAGNLRAGIRRPGSALRRGRRLGELRPARHRPTSGGLRTK